MCWLRMKEVVGLPGYVMRLSWKQRGHMVYHPLGVGSVVLTRIVLLNCVLVALAVYPRAHANGACLDPPGDVNASGATNVVDVQCVILLSLWKLGGGQGPVPA